MGFLKMDEIRHANAMASFDEACRLVGGLAAERDREWVALDQAGGRVLAQDVIARRPSPARAVSAMDGYAVRERDLEMLPAVLPVAGRSFAGQAFAGALPPKSCIRIFTGAILPAGSDRVVIQEEVDEAGGQARFSAALSPRRHVRAAGSDFAEGDVLLSGKSLVTPQGLVAIAAADLASVEVYRQPRVAILCCGDELVEPGQKMPHPERIPESLSYGVAALVRNWGGVVIARWRRGDHLAALRSAARDAVAAADIVVIVGGASVGEKDLAKDAFAAPGFEMLFSRVAIKPGKPVWLGCQGRVPVLGLPGNPTSAMVTARLFLAPLLAGLNGRDAREAWDWQEMQLGEPLDPPGERDAFLRAFVVGGIAIPLADQDSASQRALASATHLIRHHAGAPAARAGKIVETLAL
jgi:molybdopterin molybdotransferase